MKPNPVPEHRSKYAWSEIDRAEPAKRPATERVKDFEEIYGAYDESTVVEQASRCIQCPDPTCVTICPLESPIPELLSLTADGRLMEAAELLCASHSLPEIFARNCIGGRLCERACILTARSEAVPIGAISAFLLDYAWKHGVAEPPLRAPTGRRVAIIGSGICGLIGADGLSRLGHAITVIDSREKPGGRMINGLLGFRVDADLITRRIDLLKKRGVQFKMGVNCGRDVKLSALRRECDAVFLALGRANPVPLEIPGAALRGVYQADAFIQQKKRDANLHQPIDARDRRVVVLGGGDTAMDAVRAALRAGAKDVLCIYRRDAENMPANVREYENAQEEGARFLFLSEPTEIVGDQSGAVASVRCVRTKLTVPDVEGRVAIERVNNSAFDVPAEIILVAYGFESPRLPKSDDFAELQTDEHCRLMVDVHQMTCLPGVFAGGSIVRGPVSLAQVARDARRTVTAIDSYLGGLQTGRR